jgi:hypothetical protein
MRKVVLYGFVVLSVALLSSLTVTSVERKVLSPDGTITLAAAAKPTQVEVTNFPAVQPVNGIVNIGNLPVVQEVSGTVTVNNLPVDSNGNVRVTGTLAPQAIHFIGITSSAPVDQNAVGGSRVCSAEFPGTRICEREELLKSIPAPPAWPDLALVVERFAMVVVEGLVVQGGGVSCYRANLSPEPCVSTAPVACCGF